MANLVCGSIDIEAKCTDQVINDYKALLFTASTKAQHITVSSVLPRTDKI